jgi:NADPH:quinone reductase-like Zn-dependent oxidoreductase
MSTVFMDTMSAVRAHRRGGPEQLRYETAPRPEPGPGEVLVAVRCAGITAGELGWDATWTDSPAGGGADRTPIIPSHEVSGVVAALGPDTAGFEAGQRVYGLIPFTRDGAAAEFAAVPADSIAPGPAGLDHAAAAAVPLAGLTAWQALTEHAGLAAGQRVLVHGGAGGVGTFAVQVAVALGARVAATARESDAAFVRDLGADQVIDYTHGRFEEELRDIDVVFDTVGGQTQSRSWQVLRPGGVLVGIVAPPDPDAARRHDARGMFFVVEPDRTGLDALTALIDAGRLAPRIDRVVPLDQARAAYEALAGEHHGKIVLRVSSD